MATRHLASALLLAVASLLVACAAKPAANDSAPLDHLQAFADTRYFRHDSARLDRGFHVYVRLPEDFDPASRYPAVYLLDGGLTFPLLAGHLSYLRFDESLPEVVLIGISYGASEYRAGNMRSTDFTAPAASRDFWGGAGDFLAMLEDELIPRLERSYPLDSSRRVLFGQSLAGQFVLFVARERPATFAGLIASNPALHRNLALFLAPTQTFAAPGPLLFVSMGSDEHPDFREPLLKWLSVWQGQESPWLLRFVEIPGQTHMSATPEAFRIGLLWIVEQLARGERT